MAMNQSHHGSLQHEFAQALQSNWVLFLVEGSVVLLFGLAAIIIPPLATFAVAVFLGWLFLISGIVGLVTTIWMRNMVGFWWSLVSAFIGIAAGVALIGWPIEGVISLTLVLIAYFVIEGVASIMFALEHRQALSGRWGWILVSGIVDLVLALIIFSGLPGAAAWAIGLLVGINMVFGGMSLIAFALAARSIH